MMDRTPPGLDDAGLRRLLGVLRPPAPSDLLRARVGRAISQRPVFGFDRVADPQILDRARAPLYARLAASMLLAACVALATWVPPSPRADGTHIAHLRDVGAAAQGNDQGTDFGLTLVGNGAPVSRIPLVRTDWSTFAAGADDEPGIGTDNSNELDAIPLY